MYGDTDGPEFYEDTVPYDYDPSKVRKHRIVLDVTCVEPNDPFRWNWQALVTTGKPTVPLPVNVQVISDTHGPA